MLELRDVSRAVGRELVLSRASFSASRDVPTAMLGLSTMARAAFLRLLSGADQPRSGSIRLDGEDVSRVRRTKGRIVQAGGAGLKPSGRRVGKLIGAATAAGVRLGDRLGARIDELDPEQRVRLAIGVAREARPSLILLDAPAAPLAGEARARLIADLSAMLLDSGAVVVMAAGLPDEALGLGGHVLVTDRGGILQHGPAADVYAHPLNLAVALATSHPPLNTIMMATRGGRGALADGSTFQPPENMALPASGLCTLAFRPDDASLERRSLRCVRFVVRAAGEDTVSGRRFARIRFADACWLAPLPTETPPAGTVMNAFIDPTRLMVFDESGNMVA